jgi:pantetheine-phosphate adenylyltransferase
MKAIYIYPGTFCPPHWGHVRIAREAAQVFGEITVICSKNPDKTGTNWFTPKQCKEMWITYDLWPAVRVVTLDEFIRSKIKAQLVMIRGIRDNRDLKHEDEVVAYNHERYGITHFHYIFAKKEYQEISSTAARENAKNQDLAGLIKTVNPWIAKQMLKKARTIAKKAC